MNSEQIFQDFFQNIHVRIQYSRKKYVKWSNFPAILNKEIPKYKYKLFLRFVQFECSRHFGSRKKRGKIQATLKSSKIKETSQVFTHCLNFPARIHQRQLFKSRKKKRGKFENVKSFLKFIFLVGHQNQTR